MKTVKVSARITENEHRNLKVIVAKQGTTIESAVSEAVRGILRKRQKESK